LKGHSKNLGVNGDPKITIPLTFSLFRCTMAFMAVFSSFFVSYAHENAADAKRLFAVLEPLLRSSSKFNFSSWMDHQILPGEQWRAEIERALAEAHFGFLLLSPHFLASKFISENELPALLAKPMVIPVALQQIPLDGSVDLKGLADRQIFRDSKRRSFDACRAAPERRQFALELFTKVVALVEKHTC
jgi:hypothetical protein